MDAFVTLTWVGTVASIGGAGIAVWQASRSRAAADEARGIRVQLVDHREAAELAQLQALCKKAQKSIEKYGPGSVPARLAGISPEKDAGDLQEFIVALRENRVHFGPGVPNEADQFCEVLTPLLDAFAQSLNPNSLRKNGSEIVIHLSSIASVIKRQFDNKRETVR